MFGFPTPFRFRHANLPCGRDHFHVHRGDGDAGGDLRRTSLRFGEIIDTKVDSKRLGNGLRADMLSRQYSRRSRLVHPRAPLRRTSAWWRLPGSRAALWWPPAGFSPGDPRPVAVYGPSDCGGAHVSTGRGRDCAVRHRGGEWDSHAVQGSIYRNNMNLIIVATSIGFGMIPIAAPSFYDHFPSWFATIFHSGISSSAIMAILSEPGVQPLHRR